MVKQDQRSVMLLDQFSEFFDLALSQVGRGDRLRTHSHHLVADDRAGGARQLSKLLQRCLGMRQRRQELLDQYRDVAVTFGSRVVLDLFKQGLLRLR